MRDKQKPIMSHAENKEHNGKFKSIPVLNRFKYKWVKLPNQMAWIGIIDFF